MRQFMMMVTSLAAFGAMVATAQAESQNPNPRTVSGPVKKRTVPQTVRPSQQAVRPPHATCTGLKPLCFSDCGLRGTDPTYCAYRCNFEWERCMKSGFWEGVFLHRPAERR
jgi:hypothetical protein